MTMPRMSCSRIRLTTFEELEQRALLATLVKYDFTSAPGNQTSTAPAYVDDNMSAGNVTRGAGLAAQAQSNSMTASSWTTSLTPDLSDYFSFGTWTPAPGHSMTLTHLRYADQSPTTSSPFRYSLRSSLDNFTTSVSTSTYPSTGVANRTLFLLNMGSTYANLTNPIEFRLYAYDAGASSGQLRLFNHTIVNPSLPDSNGLIVDGTVQPLNEADVVGRQLFYNQSGTAAPLRYDGNDAAINVNDDLASATDKVAYLPGSGAATFANVSSYTKGINGLMIDIAGAPGTITASDFVFRVGNNNTPSSWAAAPAPQSISVRAGAGVNGSDRVVLTWANGAIARQWLEVVVLANGNTGLAQKAGYPAGQGDVFYFGNAVGDSGSGDTATQANVNATDELAARNNPQSVFNNIPITNLFDYNRDGQVNSTDALVGRNNPTSLGNVVRFISVANPPTVPEASPTAEGGGTASALSVPSTGGALAGAAVPSWLLNRLQSLGHNSGKTARYLEHLAERQSPGMRKILVAPERVDGELGLEHNPSDSLLGLTETRWTYCLREDAWPIRERQNVASSTEFGVAHPDEFAPRHNSAFPHDVDTGNRVTVRDAPLVINQALMGGSRKAVDMSSEHFLDVNSDGNVSPIDAQAVIDALIGPPLLESAAFDTPVQVPTLNDVPIATHPSQIATECGTFPTMPAVDVFDSLSPAHRSSDPVAVLRATHRNPWRYTDRTPANVAGTVQSVQSSLPAITYLSNHGRSSKAIPPTCELEPAAIDELFASLGDAAGTWDRLATENAIAR